MANKNAIATYSPEDIQVAIAGLLNITGFVEGSFVTISRDTPLFETSESADGLVSRTKRASKTFTVKLSLMSTSESNNVLTTLALLDHSSHIVKFPLLIKDSLGSTVFFSTSSWIENTPSIDYSTNINSREWSIRCSQSTIYVGGNEESSRGLEDLTRTLAGLAPSLRTLI